jgi:NAD(P)H-hydrate epimerase
VSNSNGFLSRADVREIDRAAEVNGLPTRVLMENAGRGAADVLMRLGARRPVLVCCGKGNNGGDGLVAARHLASWGVDVRALLFAAPDELTAPAAENWRAASKSGVPVRIVWPFDEIATAAELERAAWVVDALFGIGLTAPLRPPFDRLVTMMNASPAVMFAIDLPSGLDADTGEPLGPTVRASHTATFVAPKKGFANPASTAWTGKVHVVDLGLGR